MVILHALLDTPATLENRPSRVLDTCARDNPRFAKQEEFHSRRAVATACIFTFFPLTIAASSREVIGILPINAIDIAKKVSQK